MQSIDEFSVISGELTCRLCFQGEPVGIRLRGNELRYQFRWAGGYLLITTEDDFSWVYNWFWYLASPQVLRDGCALPRHEYFLSDFHSSDDRQLEFGTTHGRERWRLTIRPESRWSPMAALWVGLLNPAQIRHARRCLSLTEIT